MHRPNPCWPVCTGPGRGEGRHAYCPEWAKYDKKKFADYEEAEKKRLAEMDVNDYVTESIGRMKRGRKK